MKIKKQQLLDLYGVLKTWEQISNASAEESKKLSSRFIYAIVLNLNTLEPQVQAIQAAIAAPEAIKEFERRRVSLCHAYSTKDAAGNSVMVNNNFSIADTVPFEKAIKELQAEFATELTAYNTRVAAFEATTLQEETELGLYQISIDDLPQAGISGANMKILVATGILK